MAFSNLIAFFIILSTAATLHMAGIVDIQTSAQAAEALRPVGGPTTFLLFSLGISLKSSTWAKANNVDIAPSYMREDREGGLDALGTGFPGIKREDLMVLPVADWERMKGQLTYDGWVAAEKGKVAAAVHP